MNQTIPISNSSFIRCGEELCDSLISLICCGEFNQTCCSNPGYGETRISSLQTGDWVGIFLAIGVALFFFAVVCVIEVLAYNRRKKKLLEQFHRENNSAQQATQAPIATLSEPPEYRIEID